MPSATRAGIYPALLLLTSSLSPSFAYAQAGEEPPSTETEAGAETEPEAEPETETETETEPGTGTEAETEAESEAEAGTETETETETETDSESDDDIDEVVIEYGEEPEPEPEAPPAVAPEVTGPKATVQVPGEAPVLEPGADEQTGVEGRVVSRRPKKALSDAPVTATGADGKTRSALTDQRGRYKLFLPPGRYTLRSFYDLYHGAEWRDIAVKRGKFRKINFVLDPITEEDAGVEEQEVVYRADTATEAAQLNIRKETVSIQDTISKEEISRAGDSSAKTAVKRVVGVTIDEEGRIIIRGLGSRYNRVLMNNVEIPGVDPDIPAVKLDIFPTEIVSSLGVVKTPRADLPGNFAGGLMMVETANYPREFKLKASVSLGYNSLTTFKNRPDYDGGKLDWLGFDDGTRAFPKEIGKNRLDVGDAYPTSESVDEAAKAFSGTWNPTKKRSLPGFGLKVALGDTIDLKKNKRFGYQAAVVYAASDVRRTGFNRQYNFTDEGKATTDRENFDFEAGSLDVLWGTFGTAYLALNPDNELSITSFFSRKMRDRTLLQLGDREDNAILTTKNAFDFTARSIFFNQLSGDHRNIGDTRLRWRWTGYVSTGKREQPDRREVQQQVETQQIPRALRFWIDLDQIFVGAKTDLRFPLWQQAYAAVGGQVDYGKRDFLNRRFEYRNVTNEVLLGDPEVVLGPVGLGTVSSVDENTSENDSYEADQKLYTGFVQLESPITDWLKTLVGVRLEVFDQFIESKDPFAEPNPPPLTPEEREERVTDRTDIDFLPSLNTSFQLNEEMFIRVAYGMSVVRPAIRELAPFVFVDFLRGWNIRGNAGLERTRIQNAEVRYEWYLGESDLFAATGFFKYFKDPIEFVVLSANGDASYQNADKAWLAGGELELRFWLGRITPAFTRLYLQGNVAIMGSQTTLLEDETRTGKNQRRLYNQSPYVTNLSLRFDDPDSGVNVALVYNSFGPRIVEVGISSGDVTFPNVFQQPQHLLDLVASWQPREHWKLNFKWRNILLETNDFKQGNRLVKRENLGMWVSVGFDYMY